MKVTQHNNALVVRDVKKRHRECIRVSVDIKSTGIFTARRISLPKRITVKSKHLISRYSTQSIYGLRKRKK